MEKCFLSFSCIVEFYFFEHKIVRTITMTLECAVFLLKLKLYGAWCNANDSENHRLVFIYIYTLQPPASPRGMYYKRNQDDCGSDKYAVCEIHWNYSTYEHCLELRYLLLLKWKQIGWSELHANNIIITNYRSINNVEFSILNPLQCFISFFINWPIRSAEIDYKIQLKVIKIKLSICPMNQWRKDLQVIFWIFYLDVWFRFACRYVCSDLLKGLIFISNICR